MLGLPEEQTPLVIGVVLWMLIAFIIVFFEGYGIGSPRAGDTASEAMMLIRLHPIGRFVVLPLGTWLAWHWGIIGILIVLKIPWPKWSWVDVVAIVIGLGWAIWESSRKP